MKAMNSSLPTSIWLLKFGEWIFRLWLSRGIAPKFFWIRTVSKFQITTDACYTFYLIPVSYPGSGLELMALFSRYTGVRKHPVMYSCNQYYFPGGSRSKESACKAGRPGFSPWVGKIPWRGMATHSSTLAWRLPWSEEPGGLQPMGSQSRAERLGTALRAPLQKQPL